jgi:N-acetylmuramoyl-L-alanine amidase
MATLFKDIKLSSCPSTSILKGLNDQLLAEFNIIAPGKLVKIDDLNVTLGSAVIPFVGGPTAKAKLKAAIAARGVKLSINSAYRTFAQQYLLFREKNFGPGGCGITRVAQPGQSNHESGLALDINSPLAWKPFLAAQGWRHFGPGDLPHYDFIGGGTDLRSLGIKAFQSLWNKHNPKDLLKVDGKLGTDWQNSETIKRLLKTPIDGF